MVELAHLSRLIGSLTCGLACAWAPASATAQEAPLRAGDVLSVVCVEDPSFGGRFQVTSDGWVLFPVLGKVPAAGRTSAELAALIEGRLKGLGRLQLTSVDVRRAWSKDLGISFSGAAEVSGSLPPGGNWNLSDVVLLAKPSDSADLDVVRITDALGSTIRVPWDPAFKATERDIRLKPGDQVFFSTAELPDLVSVVGAVKSPGTVPYKDGMSVTDAIDIAGGLSGNADRTAIHVERKGKTVDTINLELGYNAKLRRADVVRVSVMRDAPTVVVTGAVIRPGPIALSKNLTLSQAVAVAGGPSPAARSDVAVLVRRVDGKLTKIGYSLGKIRRGQSPDPILEAGDVVEVPPKGATSPSRPSS